MCSGSEDARISKRRCTAEETLLTFWPPAPCARTALISISDSGIATVAEVLAMASILPRRGIDGLRAASASVNLTRPAVPDKEKP